MNIIIITGCSFIIAVAIGIVIWWYRKGTKNRRTFSAKDIGIADGWITTSNFENYAKHDNISVKYSYLFKVDGKTYTGEEVVNKFSLYDAYNIDFFNGGMVHNQPIKVVYNKDNPNDSYIRLDMPKESKKYEYTGWWLISFFKSMKQI